MECLQIINHPHTWVKEKYKYLQKLLDECEANKLNDKKSKALEILMEILEVVTHCKESLCIVAAATTHLNIGILQAEMEDTKRAMEYFKKSLDLLQESKLTPEGILPAISANNQSGLIYAELGAYEKAKDYLKQAEDLYVKFTKDVRLDPSRIVTIMGIEERSTKSILENLHTSTLYRLMDINHRVLIKQLNQNKITKNLNYIDWALNAAMISQYFIEQDKFPQARYHLAAASCILKKYSEILKAKGIRETSESIAAEYKNYDHTSADIARGWANYGIALLKASKERLLKKAEQEMDQENPTPVKVSNKVCRYAQIKIMDDLRFVDLESELESITNEITAMYLLNFNDATAVFMNVEKWLEKAKEYYTFEYHALDYTCIVKDLSQAYKYLAFFENKDGQTKMHKRRVDTLEKMIEMLCPQDYQLICKEIWIEIVETYSEILKLKISRLQAPIRAPGEN